MYVKPKISVYLRVNFIRPSKRAVRKKNRTVPLTGKKKIGRYLSNKVTVTFWEWDGNFSKSDGLLTIVTVQEKMTDKEKSDGIKNQPAGSQKKLRNRKKNLTVQEKI